MNRSHYLWLFWASLMMPSIQLRAQTGELAQMSANALSLSSGSSICVPGKDQWLFLRNELRHLSAGPFWGEAAQKSAVASDPAQRDPLAAIVAYQKAVSAQGIALLVVPVPPKAVIYPDKLPGSALLATKRYDMQLQAFYGQLRAAGVAVLDVTDRLIKARANNSEPLYCLGDSHFSGLGCKLVADAIAEEIAKKLPKLPRPKWKATESQINLTGDLQQSLQGASASASEKRWVRYIQGDPVKSDQSPVLLMGDSHTLVFDAGADLFAANAGLASQLAFALGTPVDVVGVRGSGATPARINVYRKSRANADYLRTKKVIVWCFAAREFTEATAWNATVPLK
ncbi:MAG: hypothetical protein AB7C90_00580 [Bacteroidales bacterium]